MAYRIVFKEESLSHEADWEKADLTLSGLQKILGPKMVKTGNALKAQIKSLIAEDVGRSGIDPLTDIDIKIDGDDIYFRLNKTSLNKAKKRR